MNKKLWKSLAWTAAGVLAGVGYAKLTKKRREEETRPTGGLRGSGTVIIETDRLVLREFTLEDAPAMFNNWAHDPEVTRFLIWPPHKDVDETEEILSSWIERYDEGNYYNWAIELKEIGQVVGSISVVQQDDRARRAHIGYCMGKTWWHQGVMSEALSVIIDFLFSEGYQRIDSRHDVRNPHSGDVMKKCGMCYECTMKGYDWNNAGICDTAFYAILAENYYNKNKRREEST